LHVAARAPDHSTASPVPVCTPQHRRRARCGFRPQDRPGWLKERASGPHLTGSGTMATLQTPSVEMRAHRNAEDDLFALTLMSPPPVAVPPGVAGLSAAGVTPCPQLLIIACGAAVPAARAWLALPTASLTSKERVHPPVRVETVRRGEGGADGAGADVALLTLPNAADGDGAALWLYAALDTLAPRSLLVVDVRDPPVSVLALPTPPPVAYGLVTGGAGPLRADGTLPVLPPPLMLDGVAAVACTWALGGAAGTAGAAPAAAVRTFASPFELNTAATALAVARGLSAAAAVLAAAGGPAGVASSLPPPPHTAAPSGAAPTAGGGIATGATRVFLDAVKAEWKANPAVASAGSGDGAAPATAGGSGVAVGVAQPMRVAGDSVASSGMFT